MVSQYLHTNTAFVTAVPISQRHAKFFPSITYRRQRPGLIRFGAHSATTNHFSKPSERLVTCSSASQPQPQPKPQSATPTEQSDPQRARLFTERLDTARVRARQLHAFLIARYVESASQKASSLLQQSPPTSAASSTTSSPSSSGQDQTTTQPNSDIASVARRFKKDLRSLRSTSEDIIPADDAVWTSLAQLHSLVEDLERHAGLNESASTYARDRLQEDLEGGTSTAQHDGDWNDLDCDDKVSSSPNERFSRLKRTVSGIEGRVSEFVKKDGSIDVDGLRGWVRRILDSIGTTWMRLNGRVVPSSNSYSYSNNGVIDVSKEFGMIGEVDLSKFRNEEEEFKLREEIGELEKKLNESSKKRENSLRNEDQLGKLIRARELRQMDDEVNTSRRTLAVRVLQLELNRIYYGLADEISCSQYDILLEEQRVLIIEFDDLNIRLCTLDVFIDQNETLLIDDNMLGDLISDIQDLKLRLGLDLQLYSSTTLNINQLRQFLQSSSKKARTGFEFYFRGMKLFIGDLKYALKLLNKTIIHGYTPNAREVRTLRRTGRDLLTLIPFTVVLIAPLTPVGHVLIFSFLQRYWPEFFPSTFSERRQTMMKKREVYLSMLKAAGEIEDDAIGVDNDSNVVVEDDGFLGTVNSVVGLKGRTDVVATGSSGIDLNELTGGERDSDAKARKERNRIALDELHLAD